jgi:predicted alpha/beta hydrolase family esterase
MMIRDVRLVYAPADMIGNYGGDIDNYEWPRHTGDYSFLRAYVGKDGRPADPSPDNVPYKSKDFLVVSAEGLKAGDPILLAGYPGRTSRYKLPSEIRFARDTSYPAQVAEYQADLDTIAAATKGSKNDEVRYASVAKSINNRMKKTQGLLDGFARKDIAAIKDVQDAEFRAWYGKQPNVSQTMLAELDAAIAASDAGPPILVAHSLGCALVAKWAEWAKTESPLRIAGAFLVAPSDIDAPGYPSDATGFKPMPLTKLPFPSMVVASSNDEWVSPERARAFAQAWGSQFVEIGDAGHINGDSGHGAWPEGLKMLLEFCEKI